ncbi:hypothetical protein RchiOBHm_Chr6g0279861 [Rosa chinensis]|uniref:Uncharacterized protein n=1 Tax=Rosa chinensis TaxID=74649 RepID=A0A2P6PT78_ROSCH|nr:hypothetical protein RchiOBHm_Chr6g0279861 [Rosa chinensis]
MIIKVISSQPTTRVTFNYKNCHHSPLSLSPSSSSVYLVNCASEAVAFCCSADNLVLCQSRASEAVAFCCSADNSITPQSRASPAAPSHTIHPDLGDSFRFPMAQPHVNKDDNRDDEGLMFIFLIVC